MIHDDGLSSTIPILILVKMKTFLHHPSLRIVIKISSNSSSPLLSSFCRVWLFFIMFLFLLFLAFIYATDLFLVIFAIPENPRLYARSPALRKSPSGGYAPVWVDCPSDLSVRTPKINGPLAPKEAEYIKKRTTKSIPHWRSYLFRAGLTDFDIEKFLQKALDQGPAAGLTLPNIGIALSGGGPRAALISASMVHALDDRNPQGVQAGTGGIMQLVNYVCGLSGGSWFTGSWATSNFPEVLELVSTWRLQQDNQPLDWEVLKKYPPAISIAREKTMAGFPASLVDVWALMVGKHFVNAPDYGKSVLFSSIRDVPAFRNYDAPFPIIVATSRGEKGRCDINLQTPIYEFTPIEFGVFHPSLNAFIPIDYLGTSMFNGKPIPQSACVKGFDNAAFVMGSSSNIFSEPFDPEEKKSLWNKLVAGLYEYFTKHMYDEALLFNPFNGLGTGLGPNSGFPDGKDVLLYLADGGLGGENMPIWPMMQPSRKVDVIFAIDAEADGAGHTITAHGYSNGTSLYMTYKKTLLPDYKDYRFPKIPDYQNDFSRRGLHQHPSLFGCNETDAPLVIYFPNYHMVADTDFTSVHASYTQAEIDGFFANGFAIATQSMGNINENLFLTQNIEDDLRRGGKSVIPRWPTCLACALIDRQILRNGLQRTSQCEACFRQHCV
ncbi:hypothetical protein O181_052144 [Austropuccinia psidii MF-1]|uniref:Lysophospholipase n=1 Tax=Austropuccinia psidii MF-1 TaxID=1389203 RepID=A0A9Q3E049_9BASI|nr:hypothetical protein [Austropuccinia psidii MF-1]